jgi:glycosyltransferase involved in cell wall biosynthesis
MRTRVLHIITRLEPGGAQRNTLYTVEHLDRSEFEPALAWGPGDLLDEAAEKIADIRREPVREMVRPLSLRRDLAALGRIRRLLREMDPQIVHTHSSKAGVLGRLAARLERVPVIIHSIHGYGFTPIQSAPVRALFIAVEKVVGRWTDHFIAVSKQNLLLGVELGLFRPDRASVIRSGIELDRFREPRDLDEIRGRIGVPPQAALVTQIGNFKAQKAPLDFVRMAGVVSSGLPDTWFVMVGDGRLRPAAEDLARRLGVADRMVFTGWIEDVPGLLATTDVSVLSSRHEGLPRAVVESLAAGVPVVATAVDGTVEVVRDGVNGRLVEPGDVDGLAGAVSQLLYDRGLRERMSAAAGEGLAEFDIDHMVRQQEELYRCLLGRNR